MFSSFSLALLTLYLGVALHSHPEVKINWAACVILSLARLPLYSPWLLSPPWPLPLLLLHISPIYFHPFFVVVYCHTLADCPASSLSSHPALHLHYLLPSPAPSSLPLIQSRGSTSQIDFAAVLRSPINSQIGFPAYTLSLWPSVFLSFSFIVTSTFLSHPWALSRCVLPLIPPSSPFCRSTFYCLSLIHTMPAYFVTQLFVSNSRDELVLREQAQLPDLITPSLMQYMIVCVCVSESETERVWVNVFMIRHAFHLSLQYCVLHIMGLCPCILQFVHCIICMFWSRPHHEAPELLLEQNSSSLWSNVGKEGQKIQHVNSALGFSRRRILELYSLSFGCV